MRLIRLMSGVSWACIRNGLILILAIDIFRIAIGYQKPLSLVFWDLRLPLFLHFIALLLLVFSFVVSSKNQSSFAANKKIILAAKAILFFFFLIALWDCLVFAGLVLGDKIKAFPIPLSLMVALTCLVAFLLLWKKEKPEKGKISRFAKATLFLFTASVGLVCWTYVHLVTLGKTDYRRPAEAIVVLGAKVYPSGRLSKALEDRTRTGVNLYQAGYAPALFMSGGKVTKYLSEADAMKKWAIKHGVPSKAVYTDPKGINTRSTVENAFAWAKKNKKQKLLFVSHWWHVPRINREAARLGLTAYTVPCKEHYRLQLEPYNIAREIAAFWKYAFNKGIA